MEIISTTAEQHMAKSIQITCSVPLRRKQIQCVGPAFQQLKAEKCHEEPASENGSTQSEETDDLVLNVDIAFLKSLDPKEWKDQDHYAVLGLGKKRFDATDEDIRRAYRKMVLLHHPDKRKAKGEQVNTEDDYFTCITKAYEMLGTPKFRRAYDSVDPEFDDSLPTQAEIDKNYYKVFNKYFDMNARWSEKRNVPRFGEDDAKRDDVNEFYSFWYDFKSWREFSYLDEEDKERGQDRDERRWIEKENKAARIKRKKDEMQRIRALVDLAYNSDKRILRFKNEDKEKKLAAKRARMDAAQAAKLEQERAAREAQLAKERAEKAEQKRIEQIRIEKEQQKRALKRERKTLRDRAKEKKYFTSNDKEMLKNMEGVEKICETFSCAELQQLNKQMEESGQKAFFEALKTAEKKIQAELEAINPTANKKKDVKEVPKKNELWTDENVQLLIKAVNLFPAGTAQRWDVIATFINQHSTDGANFSARDILNKAKALQHSDFSKNSLKTQANEAAFESFEKNKKDVQTPSDITINTNGTAVELKKEQKPSAKVVENGGDVEHMEKAADATNKAPAATAEKTAATTAATSKVWTKEEQALLEQAMKSYPVSTPDRWDRIAECVPNRSKKDCMRRVKELVDMVNQKNKAQQSVK